MQVRLGYVWFFESTEKVKKKWKGKWIFLYLDVMEKGEEKKS